MRIRFDRVFLAVAVLCLSDLTAGEEASTVGLPVAVEASQFEALRDAPPFDRVLDFSSAIRLTGIAVIDGEQVATVRDLKNGKNIVISGEPNDEGWKMVQIEPHSNLAEVSATISVNGGEIVTLRYDEKQLNPERKSARGQSPGPDRRPAPTEAEKRKFGEWVRGRMAKMSEEQRKRVGQIMQEKMKANPKLSDRQKGEIFVRILDHVESGK